MELAVTKTKLECARDVVAFLMAERSKAGPSDPCQTPGSGASSVPTPMANPFADLFKMSEP